ncbi:LysR substrate-binding domain-containing protein [Pacificibacter maritimus]|nr:LysR substrate-binding domain-containing protein [Pacificibacter maritimus]
MDIRRFNAFVKIVDIGSITRASAILHIAQPALSQQIAALETHFGKPLLLRSKRGVVPTEAGKVLYRHCQLILRQLDQTELEIASASEEISGVVCVGLAPLGLGSLLAAQLIHTIHQEYPGIVLYINENVGGGAMSELVMTGKMDVALLFDPGNMPSLKFKRICTEELHFVTADKALIEGASEIKLSDALATPLMLPSKIHTIRQVIDTTLARAGLNKRPIAETESISVLSNAIGEGLCATILPQSAARAVQRRIPEAQSLRIHKPNMTVNMSVCVSAQLPQSEAASVVQDRLVELAKELSA